MPKRTKWHCVPSICAASFVGSELVHQLLAAGFSVRGTARDPDNEARVGHLTALAAALPGTLTLHAADLLIEGSFDDVVKSVRASSNVPSVCAACASSGALWPA